MRWLQQFGGTNFNSYPADGPERTYSFDYANSHIVGIDMPGGEISTMTSGQIDWLDSDITDAEARGVTHTFILDHGPIYYVDGHSAKFATALVAGLPAGSTGVLNITSPTPFAALTLRSLNNERNDFLMTTFPIADQKQIAPPPIVFRKSRMGADS